MPTANERRALWFLALVALSGTVVRMARSKSADRPPDADAQLEQQLSRVDSARSRRSGPADRKKREPRKALPDTAPSTIVDLDVATQAEIETLPGIGPALAARIVAYRDSAGPFRSFEALCRVRGVGPAMIARIRRTVVFSGAPAASGGCEQPLRGSSKSHVTNRRKPR